MLGRWWWWAVIVMCRIAQTQVLQDCGDPEPERGEIDKQCSILAQRLTCICGHSRGTPTKPFIFANSFYVPWLV